MSGDDDPPADLAHVTPTYRRALWTVVGLNVGYGLAEAAGGYVAGSQALKADALDFLGDGLISFLGLLAVGWSLAWRARSALVQGVFLALLGLDRDRLGGADRLAQLAGDAAFLAVGIAAQRVFAPEARRQRPFFVRIVDRGLGREEILHPQAEALQEVHHQEILGGAGDVESHQNSSPCLGAAKRSKAAT